MDEARISVPAFRRGGAGGLRLHCIVGQRAAIAAYLAARYKGQSVNRAMTFAP
jgi:hypothetical protein